ncbi:MAG: hypothetical protein JW784_00545 [Candidatus Cloacimonetes bacterium]|nr:hypothetical protein [Candidatus Cloacimonadota bacterium]
MKSWFVIVVLLFSAILWSSTYKIQLNWDDFGGECNGFVSGTIDRDFGFVSGGGAGTALDGRLISLGEGRSQEAKQVFLIESDDGFFTFWLKDKFTDDDFGNDPGMIAASKPLIRIFRDGMLMQQISINEGSGLTCRVFSLDAVTGEFEKDIKFYPKTSIIVGKIFDAVTGKNLADADVVITEYTGESRQFRTDESGIFLFDVEIGLHELSFSKEGYIGSAISTRMGADETPREVICALSPEIRQYRIVLTWGSNPPDLDAHLSGPHPRGGNFHIWYRNRILIDGTDFLDRDDLNGYGPETITIYKPAQGEYLYSVHDYSNKLLKKSKQLSRSNALVQVFGENRLLASFPVPANQTGNCWRVFRITTDQQIEAVNQILYIENEKNIH